MSVTDYFWTIPFSGFCSFFNERDEQQTDQLFFLCLMVHDLFHQQSTYHSSTILVSFYHHGTIEEEN